LIAGRQDEVRRQHTNHPSALAVQRDLKIAVFAPMPSASVKTAINVKPGCFKNIRAP